MAETYDQLMARVRGQIRSVSLEQLKQRLDAAAPLTLIDVRELEETRAGVIPGALVVPRSSLELQIEAKVPDKSAPIVVYCAAGVRSALAARALAELGYTDVESASLGFARWRELGYPVESPRQLSPAQRERYARHLCLPQVGEAGQQRLLAAKVLLLGAGGLGSPAALYLAAAGVGTLGLVDADLVDASNLQRQILHTTSRVGVPKVDSGERAIGELNPDVKVVKFQERLTRHNVDRVFAGFDVVIDGCDNFPTRYLVNDASVFNAKPVVHGSIFRFEGQVSVFHPTGGGPCYRCLYPEPPPPELSPSCQEAGVLGILPGVIGVIQATEAIKLILGQGEPLVGRLLTYDSLRMRFGELKLRKDPSCPVCSESPTLRGYVDYDDFCAA